MEPTLVYEIIGYTASALVAVSLMMSKILRLRIVNLIGAGTFALYGVLIESMPVAGMNAFIVFINIYYLVQMARSKTYFSLLEVRSDNEYLLYFLQQYEDDIRNFQPGFPINPGPETVSVFILRDTIPAGLLTGTISEKGILDIQIDYVTPAYRDFKIGAFLYASQAQFFKKHAIKQVRAVSVEPTHVAYLRRMGFQNQSNSGVFVRDVA